MHSKLVLCTHANASYPRNDINFGERERESKKSKSISKTTKRQTTFPIYMPCEWLAPLEIYRLEPPCRPVYITLPQSTSTSRQVGEQVDPCPATIPLPHPPSPVTRNARLYPPTPVTGKTESPNPRHLKPKIGRYLESEEPTRSPVTHPAAKPNQTWIQSCFVFCSARQPVDNTPCVCVRVCVSQVPVLTLTPRL